LVVEAYLEAGVPAVGIARAGVRVVSDGEPRVESDLIRRQPASGPTGPRPPNRASVPVGDVPGIGDVSAERLIAAGVTEAAALSRLTLDRLVEVLSKPGGRSFPRSRAAEIHREARRLAGNR
jgi:hypothetical protein